VIPRQRIDADAVRGALSILDVFAHARVDVAKIHGSYRARVCPVCGPRDRADAVGIDAARNLWRCHRAACGAGGDALAALARFERLEIQRDFPRVLEIAAGIARVAPEVAPTVRTRADRERRRAEQADRDAAERARLASAASAAAETWRQLPRRCAAGESYLAGRGLDPTALIARDAVRFHAEGPAVALRDADGAVVNVARRRINPGTGPKSLVMSGGTTAGTMIGSVDAIGGKADVVIAEGITDALAAVLAWPAAVVLGAQSAGRYADVARLAAPRVRLARGRILLCLDDDESGSTAGAAAVDVCRAAGLDLARALVIVDLDPHHDLTDAIAAGWRP
jgi:hypothetical protein